MAFHMPTDETAPADQAELIMHAALTFDRFGTPWMVNAEGPEQPT